MYLPAKMIQLQYIFNAFRAKLNGMGNRVSKGLSLLEVLVSISIVAIASLGLIAAFTKLLLTQDTSSTQTVARLLAEGEAQNALLAGKSFGKPDPVLLHVGQGKTPTVFEIHEPEFTNLSKGAISEPPKAMGFLYRVSVRVSWDGAQEGIPTGPERGRQSVEVSRYAYIEQ